MLDWIATAMSFVALVFYIIVIFLLIEIKARVDGKIARSFTFLIIAILTLVIIRILNLLALSSVFRIPYLSEGFVVLFSFFVLIAGIIFYKSVKKITDRKK